jgi:hypothetical protein
MPLYEVTGEGLQQRPPAGFAALEMYERQDLQRLLRDEISALGEDLFVIAEEFGNWSDARRRIDLLALDKDGRLVVIEIKRTDDGGHMELQAIRYAAMVSSMGFDEVLEAYRSHCDTYRPDEDVDPRADLEAFLESPDADADPVISTDVRIILVSADFGREITTAVLWLNGFEGMDIRCVRLVPYELNGKVVLDIQQVIPLPEAADYQVQLRKKGAARERARRDTRDFSRYHIIVDGTELPDENKRNAVRVMVRELAAKGVRLADIEPLFRPSKFQSFDGLLTPDELRQELSGRYPHEKRERWFVEEPFHDEAAARTYVLSKEWGSRTEAQLRQLAEAFPEAKITFRKADLDVS